MTVKQRISFCIFFVLSISLNLIGFFHARFASNRNLEKKFDTLAEDFRKANEDLLNGSFIRLNEWAAAYATNHTFKATTSSSTVGTGTSVLPSEKDNTPLYARIDEIPYHFYKRDGIPVARIWGQDFSQGSPYPRGGVIRRVYEDCIILEGDYLVKNSSLDNRFLSSVPSSSTITTKRSLDHEQ